MSVRGAACGRLCAHLSAGCASHMPDTFSHYDVHGSMLEPGVAGAVTCAPSNSGPRARPHTQVRPDVIYLSAYHRHTKEVLDVVENGETQAPFC